MTFLTRDDYVERQTSFNDIQYDYLGQTSADSRIYAILFLNAVEFDDAKTSILIE